MYVHIFTDEITHEITTPGPKRTNTPGAKPRHGNVPTWCVCDGCSQTAHQKRELALTKGPVLLDICGQNGKT